MVALIACLPIFLILALMLGRHWSAARAGLAGAALAGLLAWTVFAFGATDPLRAFVGVCAEAAFTTATILWILWPALAIQHLQQDSGAVDKLRLAMARVSSDPFIQALLIGFFLALFFEGAAGFGTPIALTAPLLVTLGMGPVQAVVVALLGHAAGVSFGALGTPVLAQETLTGVPAGEIAWRTALLHVLCGGLLMTFFMRAAVAGIPPAAASRGRRAWAFLAAAAFLGFSFMIALTLGAELATLGASLMGALLLVLLLRWFGGTGPRETAAPTPPRLWLALAPYLVLVVLVILTRLPPVTRALSEFTVQWRLFDDFTGRMVLLSHPGTLLLAALLIGAALQSASASAVQTALGHSARRLVPVALALVAMLALSRLMVHAGMIDAIQQQLVLRVGPFWPLVSPALGALGSFVTGSATASNVLFSSLQSQTAQALSLPVAMTLAGQGFGAAVGNIVCPHNVVAGAATVGLAGREAEILGRTLLPCLLYLLAGGATLFLLLEFLDNIVR